MSEQREPYTWIDHMSDRPCGTCNGWGATFVGGKEAVCSTCNGNGCLCHLEPARRLSGALYQIGASIEKQIDADLQRALDLLTLADLPRGWMLQISNNPYGSLRVTVHDVFAPMKQDFYGATAIDDAAEWVRAQKEEEGKS